MTDPTTNQPIDHLAEAQACLARANGTWDAGHRIADGVLAIAHLLAHKSENGAK